MSNHRPSPPSDARLNGVPESGVMSTKRLHRADISAVIDDPDGKQQVRLVAYVYHDSKLQGDPYHTEFGKQDRREHIEIRGLKKNTKYQVKLYTQDRAMKLSNRAQVVTFWTNRPPSVELVQPQENAEYDENPTGPEKILFSWKFNDDDDKDSQSAYQIRFKHENADEWRYIPSKSEWQEGKKGKNWFYNDGVELKPNRTFIWSVRVKDEAGISSEWAIEQSFYVRGIATPPIPLEPTGGYGRAAIATRPITFTWKFTDPSPGVRQTQADIRWRVVGSGGAGGAVSTDEGWFTRYGQGTTPGPTEQWEIPIGSFQAGFLYEWQVRTTNTQDDPISKWSTSGSFVATGEPGGGLKELDPLFLETSNPLGSLGCGDNRVFIYARGGKYMIGEVKPLARVQWSRLRDDISNAIITTNGFGADCCELLGSLRSWAHEVVIFRDGQRVFEGPITRLTYTATEVEIEAKDVMAYLYRRILRKGYNDAYQRVDLTPRTKPKPAPSTKGGPYLILGENTVVERAVQITVNALAYKDPNVLPYLTAIQFEDDKPQRRATPDYAKSAWEEIDDLAANGGLDYAVIGRRIMYWDTNRNIGRLPEMRDGDFDSPVIVTEYGMQTSNYFAVSNNTGVYGAAYPLNHNESNWDEVYGPVEMVSSAYGETDGTEEATESLNRAAHAKLEESLRSKAQKAIAHRWPTPVVCRVPDNSRVSPDAAVTIQQLVPGVWIPLRATMTCRNVEQWQKLDAVNVEQVEGQEFVRLTMSPAPHGGNDDPDLTGQEEVN